MLFKWRFSLGICFETLNTLSVILEHQIWCWLLKLLVTWNLEQVCKPWTGLLTLNRSWPITSAAPGHMIYWACSVVKIWCSRFTVSDIEIWCKALTLVLVPGHKIYWACSVEMFEVYICLFKVYRGVQGVKGSFTFTLTVFEVEIASTCLTLGGWSLTKL